MNRHTGGAQSEGPHRVRASAPLFEIAADDFALCLRARMHLPCRIAPFFEVPAHPLLHQRGIAIRVHDAIHTPCNTTMLSAHKAMTPACCMLCVTMMIVY